MEGHLNHQIKKPQFDCSIVIVNYNTSHLIIDLIGSVKRFCTRYLYEIIVVDNASPVDNPNNVTEKHPEVRLILNAENEGFGRANNIGIHHSKGRYILLLNSDTLVVDDALDRCIDFMQSHFAKINNIGLMACKLLNEDMTNQPSTFSEFSLRNYLISSNALLRRLSGRTGYQSNGESRFVGAVSGAFMLFHNKVFEKVQPFDPDIFMYSEETELCRERVSKYFNIYYWAEASIIHFGGVSTNNKMQLQEMVSYALTWYKKGTSYYIIFIFSLLINSITEVIFLIFMKKDNRTQTSRKLSLLPKLFIYLLFEIPRYSRRWGGRHRPLKVTL